MKKIYLLAVALAGTLLTSCSYFLDKVPLVVPSSETFLTNQSAVTNYVNGLYIALPSAGAYGMGISDEAFMEKTRSWLDNLKLRVSYGITGNSGGTTAYSTTTQAYVYAASGISINGKIVPFTQYSGTYGSSDLGWEKSYNWNVGLDFGILNGRIDGSVEWFKTTTKGLLFKRILPITSGLARGR